MDVRDEIAAQVGRLPQEMQNQVLRFVSSLASTATKGERGTSLRAFSGVLDPVSAGEMTRVIEEECERVDADGW